GASEPRRPAALISPRPVKIQGLTANGALRHRRSRPRRPEPEPYADISTDHPPAPGILGPAGLRPAAALRHGSRGGYLPHRHLPARARPGTLARRLRPALAPPQGRPLRRKPQPAPALLPVPGRAQALAAR